MTVTIEDVSGARGTGAAVDVERLARQARFLLAELRLHPDTELSVRLAGEDEMARLHEQWMGEPGPTDVLSFPMDELRAPAPGEDPVPGILGDVVVCPQVAARQAADAGHRTEDEVAMLLTHGLLHLLGHDHAEPEEHARMFELQDRLLAAWRATSGTG